MGSGASSKNKYTLQEAVQAAQCEVPEQAPEGRGPKATGSEAVNDRSKIVSYPQAQAAADTNVVKVKPADNASANTSATASSRGNRHAQDDYQEVTADLTTRSDEIEAQFQQDMKNQPQSRTQSRSSTPIKQPKNLVKDLMTTKAAFTAQDSNQLTVGRGVKVEAIETHGQWCWCRHNGLEGWLPWSYLSGGDESEQQKDGADQSAQQESESSGLPEQWVTKLRDTMVLHTVQNTVKLAQYLVQLLTSGYGTVSSLHIACWEGSVDAVTAVAGTEQAVRMWHSRKGELTPLHIASICGHYKVVDYLVSNLRGDEVNLPTVHEICPLHIGASSSSEITEVLIGAKADPGISTTDEDTPLHFACCYQQVPTIKILLNSGADAAAANAFGVTPLHIAAAYAALENCSLKEAQVVLLLCSKGANPAVTDRHGRTPAGISRMADGRNELTEFLERCSTAAQAQAEAQRILDELKSGKKRKSVSDGRDSARDSARGSARGDPFSDDDADAEEGELADILSKSPRQANKKGAEARKEQSSEMTRLADDNAKLAELLSQTRKELEDSKSSQALLQELLDNSRRMAEQMKGMSDTTNMVNQNNEVIDQFKNDMEIERGDFKKQLESSEIEKSKLVEELETKQKQLDDAVAERQKASEELQQAYIDAEEKAKQMASAARSSAAQEAANAASEEAANESAKAQGVINTISAELNDVQKTLQKEREDAKATQSRQLGELDEAKAGIKRKQEEITKLTADRDDAQKNLTDLRQQHSQLREEHVKSKISGQQTENEYKQKVMAVEGELQDAQIRIRKLEEDLAAAEEQLKQMEEFRQRAEHAEKMLEPFKRRVQEVQEQFDAEQALRKRYHNQLQDLKGAIRVYARVRPMIQREHDLGDPEVLKKTDAFSMELDLAKGKAKDLGKSEPKSFTFDSIFNANNTQEDVYAECKDLVISCCDGFNVTIFAYGQTGAGKTHTMYGSADNPGLVPRITNDMFKVVERLSKEKEVSVKCTMCELYKDDLVDLLWMGGKKQERPNLIIRPDARGTIYVENITERTASCAEDLRKAITEASERRHVASTKMNSDSSRSHLIFTIIIESTHKQNKQVAVGKLTLIDLAGSERLKKSGATGEQMKEAQSINKSLTALGDVIEALTKNSKHIPYRNHKLTQLLADSLGGNAKTLMFVNCSPAGSNADESNSSLTYAARAKLILNKVQKNEDSQEVARLKKVITTMSKEMDGLRGGAGPMELPPEC